MKHKMGNKLSTCYFFTNMNSVLAFQTIFFTSKFSRVKHKSCKYPGNRDSNLVKTDAFKVFDSFSVFGKPISNLTKLPDNLPFGSSVIHNTTVSKIQGIQITLISDESLGAKDAVVVEVHSSSPLRF